MSIDEVMAAASRLATTTAVFTTPSGDLDTDGESAVQERSMQLRAAIERLANRLARHFAPVRVERRVSSFLKSRRWQDGDVIPAAPRAAS